MSYIALNDITDRLIKPIVTADSSYFTRAGKALEDLALSKEVLVEQIALPVHYRVTEYLRAWIGWAVCLDLMGVSPKKLVEEGIQDDPYEQKIKFYKDELVKRKALITPEVLKNTADRKSEFAGGVIDLYRT